MVTLALLTHPSRVLIVLVVGLSLLYIICLTLLSLYRVVIAGLRGRWVSIGRFSLPVVLLNVASLLNRGTRPL